MTDKEPVAALTRLPDDLRQALAQHYTLLDHQPAAGARPGIRLAVTTSMAGVDEAAMASLPDLRFIGCQGVGLDRIDLAAAHRRGIAVAHTPDVLTEDVADFALALMYGVARRLVEADRFVRAGRWSRERMQPSMRLHGKTAGVVGLGRIGMAVARRAEGIGMRVIWHGPRPNPEVAWDYVPDLHTLALRSDILFLVVPGGDATRRMVGAEVLEALGPRGILVNVARGSVVDETALLDALEQGRIGGAGLDVFATEPDLNPRFPGLGNVVLAPHYASLTHETRAEMIGMILDNIAAWRDGRPFPDVAAGAA